jgi:hypothetical protein
MNAPDKKHSFFNDSLAILSANCESYFSHNMKTLTIFLFLFSGLCFNIEAYSLQVPAKAKPAVATTKPANLAVVKGKSKGKKLKKVVIKKDTMPEIDPANTSSPLYNKN